jgi:hypothetical protein
MMFTGPTGAVVRIPTKYPISTYSRNVTIGPFCRVRKTASSTHARPFCVSRANMSFDSEPSVS